MVSEKGGAVRCGAKAEEKSLSVRALRAFTFDYDLSTLGRNAEAF